MRTVRARWGPRNVQKRGCVAPTHFSLGSTSGPHYHTAGKMTRNMAYRAERENGVRPPFNRWEQEWADNRDVFGMSLMKLRAHGREDQWHHEDQDSEFSLALQLFWE